MVKKTERQKLAEAYRATTYVGMPDGEPHWRIRVDEQAPVDGPMAYITSDNPGSEPLDEEKNNRRRIQLKADLRAAGYDSVRGKSVADDGDWPDEHGFWVRSINRSEALDLAERYGQNAILFVDEDNEVELLFCNTGPSSRTDPPPGPRPGHSRPVWRPDEDL